MNSKSRLFLLLGLFTAVTLGYFLLTRHASNGSVTVTLRIAVTPAEESGFVADQANSAKFKYLLGKQTGIKPTEAQKLTIKTFPNSALLEARVAVATRDEGNHYIPAFIPALQTACGTQAQVALVEHSIR